MAESRAQQFLKAFRARRDVIAEASAAWLITHQSVRPPRASPHQVRAAVAEFLADWDKRLDGGFEIKATRKAIDRAREYLIYADNDLRLIRILRREQAWADLVYHLQQAVEKSVSALAIGMGILDEQDPIILRHDIARRILSFFNKAVGKEFLGLASGITGKSYQQILKKVNRLIDQHPDKIRHLPESDLRILMNLLNAFRWPAVAPPGFAIIVPTAKRILMGTLPEFKDEIVRWTAPVPIDATRSALRAYLLGILLSPHENSTRYPGHGYGPEAYGPDLPIVRLSPLIERHAVRLHREVTALLA